MIERSNISLTRHCCRQALLGRPFDRGGRDRWHQPGERNPDRIQNHGCTGGGAGLPHRCRQFGGYQERHYGYLQQTVVPLMSLEDQANLVSPIEISPAVAGSGQWVSSSSICYSRQPGWLADSLPGAGELRIERYHPAAPLEQDYVWGF